MPKPEDRDVGYGQTRDGIVWHVLRPVEGASKKRAPAYCGSTPRHHLWHYWRSGSTFYLHVRSERVLCRRCIKALGWPADA